jgi:hypothetical protein
MLKKLMGERHHSYTGLLLIGFALLLLLAAIFFTIAQNRIINTSEYRSGNSKLRAANNWLIVSYVLSYIATGVGIVLAILYFGHVTWGIKTEVPHAVLFVLLFLHVILAGIFGFVALSEINNSGLQDKRGSENWIWAAEIVSLVAVVILIISGAWRAQHRSVQGAKEKSDQTVNVQRMAAEQESRQAQIRVGGATVSLPEPPSYSAPPTPSVNQFEPVMDENRNPLYQGEV